MNKKLSICIYIAVFIIFCYLANTGIKNSIARQIDNRSPYYLSFASIGANLLESRLDCWAKIKTVKNFNELDQELVKILVLLKLPVEESSIQHRQDQDKLIASYQGAKGNTKYHIQLQSDKHTTYFLLTAISQQDDILLRADEKLLKQHYQSKSYFQYQGIVQACPDQSGQQKMLYVMGKCLHVRQSDIYKADDLVSIAAFSPQLARDYEGVELAGKTYNLQMAIHSDSSKNQSYVYLGIPLLMNEY